MHYAICIMFYAFCTCRQTNNKTTPKLREPNNVAEHFKLTKQTLYHSTNLSKLLKVQSKNKIPGGLTIQVKTKENLSNNHKNIWDEALTRASTTLLEVLIEHHLQQQESYQEKRLLIQKNLSTRQVEENNRRADEEINSKKENNDPERKRKWENNNHQQRSDPTKKPRMQKN
eukprot:TCONS_00050837-protein